MQILKLVLAAALLIAALGCGEKEVQAPLTEAPYYNSLAEAQAAMGSADKFIVLKFYTDWCTWCHRLDTVVLVNQKAIQFFADTMLLVKINAEVDTLTARRYNVSGYPTLVMVDKDGNEVDRLVGYLEVDEFLQTWRDYAKGIGTLDDLLRRSESETERGLFMEIAEKYKYRGGMEEARGWYEKVVAAGEPTDSLSGECRLALADMIRRAKDYPAAIAEYEKIMVDFATLKVGEEAEIWAAICCRQAGDTVKAIERFDAFVSNHPQADSENVAYCRDQVEKLKNPPPPDTATH